MKPLVLPTAAIGHSAHLLFDVLQGAYDTHLERAQMRLAPLKPRSCHDIPRRPEGVLASTGGGSSGYNGSVLKDN